MLRSENHRTMAPFCLQQGLVLASFWLRRPGNLCIQSIGSDWIQAFWMRPISVNIKFYRHSKTQVKVNLRWPDVAAVLINATVFRWISWTVFDGFLEWFSIGWWRHCVGWCKSVRHEWPKDGRPFFVCFSCHSFGFSLTHFTRLETLATWLLAGVGLVRSEHCSLVHPRYWPH